MHPMREGRISSSVLFSMKRQRSAAAITLRKNSNVLSERYNGRF